MADVGDSLLDDGQALLAAANATAVVVASEGADSDVTVTESSNSKAFGGN